MNEELKIQKLKQAKDEILAKANALVDACEQGDPQKIKSAIEALRPKPERLRCWIERDRGGLFKECHFTEPSASLMGRIRTQQNTIQPMIEVRPLPEPPEMEEWDKERVTSEMKHSERSPFDDYRELVSRHNATVRAFKKWAEAVKKEVGDE